MAKKDYGKVMEGLFTEEGRNDTFTIPSMQKNKQGRKPAKDIEVKEKIYRTTIYLTKNDKKMLHDYSFENEITISETIRSLIRKNL